MKVDIQQCLRAKLYLRYGRRLPDLAATVRDQIAGAGAPLGHQALRIVLDAELNAFAFAVLGQDERVAPHNGWQVSAGQPVAVFVDEEVLIVAQAHDRHSARAALSRKRDGIGERRDRDLGDRPIQVDKRRLID